MAHSGTIIYMQNVPGDSTLRELSAPLPIQNMDGSWGEIPTGFRWNGASGFFLTHMIFPRHNHPVSTSKHDYRCSKAKNKAERKFADDEFKKDVETTSWKITAWVGYLGVRIGDFFGIGNGF